MSDDFNFSKKCGENIKNSPIYVVSGRSGPKLSQETLDFLIEHDAQYVIAHAYNPKPWFNFSNKIAAVSWAQENLTTEYIAWLDSDILIAGDFTKNLPDIFDFAGRCETNAPAVHFNEHKYYKYWKKISEMVDYNFDNMPWISLNDKKVKPYLNSGFFIWRKETEFAKKYRTTFIKVIDSRYSTVDGHAWFADQVILSPIIYSCNLNFHHLSFEDHHMTFFDFDGMEKSPPMNNSNLIHYSKSMNGHKKSLMMKRLISENPIVHQSIIDFEINHQGIMHIKRPHTPKTMARLITQKIFMKFTTKV